MEITNNTYTFMNLIQIKLHIFIKDTDILNEKYHSQMQKHFSFLKGCNLSII